MNQIDLAGRTAVITGGGQGIGRACAEKFLASAAAGVALWDVDTARAGATAAELGARAHAFGVDVTDADSVAAALEATLAAMGHVDILINSAGNYMAPKNTWEYSLADWHTVVGLHLTGHFVVCRAIVPHMIERNYGRICNFSSVAGKEGNPGHTPYSAAKAGIIALTKCLARETAEHDIAVNAIAPETVKTRITAELPAADVALRNSRVPRGRFVELDEITAMIAFIVSADNSFTTGATFDLTGGRSSY